MSRKDEIKWAVFFMICFFLTWLCFGGGLVGSPSYGIKLMQYLTQ
jgi:hypothetical protein